MRTQKVWSCPQSSLLNPQSLVLNPQSSILNSQSSIKTVVLLQKPWFTAFLSRMSRKHNILKKIANEDKLQVVQAWWHIVYIWSIHLTLANKCEKNTKTKNLVNKYIGSERSINCYQKSKCKGTRLVPCLVLPAFQDCKTCQIFNQYYTFGFNITTLNYIWTDLPKYYNNRVMVWNQVWQQLWSIVER